jgi:hypothetical protein
LLVTDGLNEEIPEAFASGVGFSLSRDRVLMLTRAFYKRSGDFDRDLGYTVCPAKAGMFSGE